MRSPFTSIDPHSQMKSDNLAFASVGQHDKFRRHSNTVLRPSGLSMQDRMGSKNIKSTFLSHSTIKAIDPEEEQERRVLNMVNRV